MNFRNISIIIRREYLNRVMKKSFWIMTFVAPILLVALMFLPSLVFTKTKEAKKTIAVLDNSGIVSPYLHDNDIVSYINSSTKSLDSLKAEVLHKKINAILWISPLDTAKLSLSASTYSEKPLGMGQISNMKTSIDKAVSDYRLKSYNIKNLTEIVNKINFKVDLLNYSINDKGGINLSSSELYSIISIALTFILYTLIVSFSSMIMSSVIDEKASRVVEVLLSSVTATELILAKLLGLILVALSQFLLWIVITAILLTSFMNYFSKKDLDSASAMNQVSMISNISANQGAGATVSINDLMQNKSVSEENNTEHSRVQGAEANLQSNKSNHAEQASSQSAQEHSKMQAAKKANQLSNNSKINSQFASIYETLKNMDYMSILIAFLIYTILGFFFYASFMAAIGAAVDNQADASTLQGPIMLLIVLAMIIGLYANKSPDSGIVLWASMIPFTSPVVMLSRIAYGVPFWQLALSITIMLISCVIMLWISAKIFRSGIMIFGQKHSWKEILSWIKQK